jgi:hypothetical protein
MGLLQKSTKGLGTVKVRGLNRVPYPKGPDQPEKSLNRTTNENEGFHGKF